MTEQEQKAFDQMREALNKCVGALANYTTPGTFGGRVPIDADVVNNAIQALTAANAVSVEPELVAIEGMPQGLGNEPEILAQWDAVKAASEGEWGKRQWHSVGAWLYEGDAIAVISDAVSHQKPETTPAPEGGGITAESDHIPDAGKMVQPLGWYCVSRDGLATQCADRDDALQCAKLGALDWPNSAPYRAVQLCEYTHPQASEPAPEAK